jgi:hypothetical protein
VAQQVAFHPTATHPRGAYGVVGMLLTDMIPSIPGDELIVSTLSGDLIAFNISPAAGGAMTEIWRTHVDGNIGHYNSILAEDLNGDGRKELYVAGSLGLWRFKDRNDVAPPPANL